MGFIWVPAHMDVEGNEEADYLAKNATHEDKIEITLQYRLSEYTSVINKAVKEMWQNTWEMEKKGRSYFTIQKKVEKTKSNFAYNRKDSVVITRLRVGRCEL